MNELDKLLDEVVEILGRPIDKIKKRDIKFIGMVADAIGDAAEKLDTEQK